MKEFIQALFIAVTVVVIVMLSIHYLWDPIPPVADPTTQELRAEINRLKHYEAFVDSQNVSVVYNGCEDLAKRLGVTP